MKKWKDFEISFHNANIIFSVIMRLLNFNFALNDSVVLSNQMAMLVEFFIAFF